MIELHVTYQGKVVGDNRRLRINRKYRRPAYPDPDYAAFKEALAWAVMESMGRHPPATFSIHGPAELEVRCWVHRKMDQANLLKPVQDVLQSCGVVLDDNQFQRSTAVRSGTCKGGPESRLELVVREVEGEQAHPAG